VRINSEFVLGFLVARSGLCIVVVFMFYPRDIYCIMLYCFSLRLAIHSAYFIKRFSLLTAMMSNKLLGTWNDDENM